MNGKPIIRLAVVDDHPIVVAGLKALLQDVDGINLTASATSYGKLHETWSSNIDVIFLDLNIPGESYIDNINKAKLKFPKAKIAAYTSYGNPNLAKEILNLGCQGFLLKQISKEEIIKAIYAINDGERYVDHEVSFARIEPKSSTENNSELKDDFQKRLSLSKREKQILLLISQGYTSKHIAEQLFISRYTVETHRKNILRKLNFNTSTELVKFAVLQGLV